MTKNGENDWSVGWSAISFFQSVLGNHTSVRSFNRINDIQFEIQRHKYPDVNVVIVDNYMLGEATVYAILDEFDGVTAVVNNGTWNHVAFDWRDFAKQT